MLIPGSSAKTEIRPLKPAIVTEGHTKSGDQTANARVDIAVMAIHPDRTWTITLPKRLRIEGVSAV